MTQDNDTRTHASIQSLGNDIDALCQEALQEFRSGLTTLIAHFKEHELKSSCSVSIEIAFNRDADIVVKVTPKLNLPQASEEFLGMFDDDGSFKLM